MERLTLQDICPYLPYELKVECNNINNDKQYKTVVLQFTNSYTDITAMSVLGSKWIKLILRSMDLTKPIVVDGKEIIPIVELAEICCKTNDWVLWNGKAQRGGYMNSEMFSYQGNNFYRWDSDGPNHVENQIILFQKLAEWKIDFMGLIEKGLAMDADSLNINPYN